MSTNSPADIYEKLFSKPKRKELEELLEESIDYIKCTCLADFPRTEDFKRRVKEALHVKTIKQN